MVQATAPLVAGDDVEEGGLGVPMFFGGIGVQPMVDAVTGAGLTLERAEQVPEDEGAGKVVSFLWVTATKPAQGTSTPAHGR